MQFNRFRRLATGAAALTLAASVGIALAPSAFAAPAATATPNTALKEGTIMSVTGSGMPANTTIQMEECVGTAASPPADNTKCDALSLDTQSTADGSGNFVNQVGDANGDTGYFPYELGVPGSTYPQSTIRCDANNPCTLYVGVNQNDFSKPHVFLDMAFATYGNGPKLKNQTATTAFAGKPGTVNVLNQAVAFDSVGAAETIAPAGPYQTSAPANGTVTVDATGIASYTPNAGTVATSDSFTVAGTANGITGPPAGQSPAKITVAIGHGNNPTLVAQTASVAGVAGATTTFKTTNTPANGVLTGATATDSSGAAETLIGVAVTGAAPAFGAVTGPTGANNDFTYTVSTPSTAPANGGTDHFSITATYAVAGTTTPTFASTQVESVVIAPTYASSCDATSASCTLTQQITAPVAGSTLTMSQSVGLPVDLLDHTPVGANCTGPSVTLNGQPQVACGAMAPITVVNARGTANLWSLTGIVANDFLDTVGAAKVPTLTCDTVATYNRDCIPAGNLGWAPAAAVAQGLVPGDVAAVSPGAAITPPGAIAPTVNPNNLVALNGFSYQPYATTANVNKPSNEPTPPAGLHSAATLCNTASGTSGGTFDCGATLSLAIPASASADTNGYTALLVLTLT